MEGLYVYCIVGTGEARNFGPLGIGGRGDTVTNIAYRDVSAVVSAMPMDRYVISRETMLCHQKVLERVMADHTILPVRFYTVAPNAEEIRTLLRTRYTEFKKLLRELDNKVELGLKALWKDMNAILAEMAQQNVEAGALGVEPVGRPVGGKGQAPGDVKTRVKEALEEKKAGEREVLLQPLRQLSGDYCLNKTYGDDMIMNAAFLVDRAREREFDSHVQRLSVEHGERMEFKYVGPAPPYSFVNIVVKD